MNDPLFEKLIKIRRKIHQNPELGFHEFETSQLIASELNELDIPFETIAETGIIGTIKKGEGPTVILRADIDALPIKEESTVLFPSKKEGIMHACGHDLHTTMLIGAAHLMLETTFEGTVKLVFQPSEEGNARSPQKGKSGGQIIAESGKLNGAKAALGLHVHPLLPVGTLGFRNGEALANVGNFTITISGKGGHPGAMEHVTDPVLISGQLITTAQSIISHAAPLQAAVLAFATIHSEGEPSFNIIPQTVVLQGSLRAISIEAYQSILGKLNDLLAGLEITYKCRIGIEWSAYYPSLLNDPLIHTKLLPVQENIFGRKNISEVPAQLIGEDFAFYSRLIPSQFYFLGAQTAENNSYFLHHPKVTFNEDCIKSGSEFLAQGAVALIKN